MASRQNLASARFDKGIMQLILRNNGVKRTLMLLEATGFIALVIWISKAYLADVVARKASVKDLELAVRLDPGNSDYYLQLGRLFQHSLADIDPEKALRDLRRAAELNPRDPRPWLDLGVALEFQGRIPEAETCLRRADFLAPNIPSIQWSIGNFFLLYGNIDEAFRHFKVVLAGTSEYNRVLFDTAWKSTGDPSRILAQLIPSHVPTEFDYLYYLLAQKRYPEAQNVWKRIVKSSETFSPGQAAGYIDNLIGARQPDEASRVWNDLLKKGLIKPTYAASDRNLLVNGDFEEDNLNMGFDWRILPLEVVYTGLDQTTFHSPSHSLLIQFSGKQNIYYQHVYQYIRVAPGSSYRLQGFMRTEGITTDSGPRLEVRDAYDYNALDKFSEGLPGSTGGWTPLILDFTTGQKTELILVSVARLPSHKLDNLIAGKVWLDDLSLNPLAGQAERSQK